MFNSISKIKLWHLWFIFFLFIVAEKILFFEFIMSYIPQFFVPNTSFTPDALYANTAAIKMAQDIKLFGWSSWSMFPGNGLGGQCSFLAIFYYFFGVYPIFAFIFSAFFHALSGILIYQIATKVIGSNNSLKYFALLPALMFVMLPSSMIWVGQINKDTCLASGFLLGLWFFIKIISDDNRTISILKNFTLFILSIALIAAMKPYMLQIYAAIVLCLLMYMFIKRKTFSLKSYFLLIICLFFISVTFYLISAKNDSNNWITGDQYIHFDLDETYKWKQNPYLPAFLDSKFKAISSARSAFIFYGEKSNAKSMIDTNVHLYSASDVIKYFPRALQISIFSSFPKALSNNKLIVLFSYLEIILKYVGFIGLLFYIYKGSLNSRLIVCFIFAIIPLLIIGLTIPNMGTIYRVRYPFEMIILTLGICGWANFFKRIKCINKTDIRLKLLK